MIGEVVEDVAGRDVAAGDALAAKENVFVRDAARSVALIKRVAAGAVPIELAIRPGISNFQPRLAQDHTPATPWGSSSDHCGRSWAGRRGDRLVGQFCASTEAHQPRSGKGIVIPDKAKSLGADGRD
jgi:hypothetical protein